MALPPDTSSPANDKNRQRDAAAQDTFVREVDDALRQDQLEGFFKRFGIPLLAVVVIGLAGLGGYLWWDHEQEQAANERGEQFIVALDQLESDDLKGAYDKLGPIVDADGTASAVAAKLLRAGIALEQRRPDEAVKTYTEIAADSDTPQPFRDLANVRLVSVQYDTMKPQDVIARLKPLAVPGNPWFGVAGEMVGMAYLAQGKNDLAGPMFASIARDENLPESLRGRARQLAGMLGVDALDDVLGGKGKNNAADADATPAKAE